MPPFLPALPTAGVLLLPRVGYRFGLTLGMPADTLSLWLALRGRAGRPLFVSLAPLSLFRVLFCPDGTGRGVRAADGRVPAHRPSGGSGVSLFALSLSRPGAERAVRTVEPPGGT